MPHTGLDPVTFAYLSLSLPSSRGVRSGLFSKPFYRVLLGFKNWVKQKQEKKNLIKYSCTTIEEELPLSHKRNAGGCFSFRWWSLEKSTTTHKRTYLLYVRVTACKGEREREEKKRFSSSASVLPLLCIIITIYKNNSLKNGVPFRVY